MLIYLTATLKREKSNGINNKSAGKKRISKR